MDNERWYHVDKLLQSALDRPAVERDVFVRRACGGDAQGSASAQKSPGNHGKSLLSWMCCWWNADEAEVLRLPL